MRDRAIDFLKGLAIIGIVMCHASQPTELNSLIKLAFSFGQWGCQVFFFFSGYLMYKHFINEKNIKPFSFLVNKIKGVAVPWYLSIFIFAIIGIIGANGVDIYYQTNTSISSIIVNTLFLNGIVKFANNNVVPGGWYIGTLVIIWLAFPFYCRICEKIKDKIKLMSFTVIICWIIMGWIGVVGGSQIVARNTFAYFSFVNQFQCIICGMLAIEIKEIWSGERFISILSLLIAVVLFVLNIPFGAIVYPTLICVFVGMLHKIIGGDYNKTSSLLLKSIEWFGRNSLYVYLTHIVFVWYFQYNILQTFHIDGVGSAVGLMMCFTFLIVPGFAVIFKKVCNKLNAILKL